MVDSSWPSDDGVRTAAAAAAAAEGDDGDDDGGERVMTSADSAGNRRRGRRTDSGRPGDDALPSTYNIARHCM